MSNELDGNVAIERLKDHYKHCIRLSASNKINPKNAFDLQLIDYMQDLVSNSEDGQMNFKIASSALDVGAKIYSNRVDRIQSEAQKVASSILMALDGQTGNDPDESQANGDTTNASDRLNDSRENEDEGQAKASKKKRPTRNKNIKTVVEDVTSIDAKLEKMVLGDAFLDGLSQDFDMSCPAALICYNALTQPSGLLTIESSYNRKNYLEPEQAKMATNKHLSVIVETVEDDATEENGSNTDIKENCSKPQKFDEYGDSIMTEAPETKVPGDSAPTTTATNSTLSNNSNDHYNLVTLITKNVNCAQIIRNNQTNHICPRLENFLFNDRTTTISGLNSTNDTSKLFHSNDQQNLSGRPTGGDHEFNPELYDNNNDDCGDDYFGDADSVAEGENHNRNENDLIPNLDKIAASKPTDYGYSSEHHRLLNTWAGPHAWKVVKVPLTAKKEAPKSTRKRAKMEQKPINFEEKFLTNLEEIVDKDIRHSSDVIRKWKKPLLPQDHNLDEDYIRTTLIHTFLRPEDTYHCKKTPADALKLVDIDHDYTKTDRNKDADDDEAPASPGLGGFDDVHDDSDDEFRADPIVEGNEVAIYGAAINNSLTQQADLEFAGEHLIEQPYTVAQVNIPFAKIAKKMDVRKLKRVMWDLLLPPDKRLELTTQANITIVDVEPDGGNGKQNSSNENGHSTTLTDGDHNETVIMNGTQKDAAKNTPSPTPSESLVHLEFSHLYGELPVRVSSKMASDLSQPIAFVTLLHLANEKNLKLIPKQDLKDFIIEQDEVI